MQGYQKWLLSEIVDSDTKNELSSITEEEIKSRFDRGLGFGTAGLRALMGVGTSRLNKYTVRHVSQCIADLVNRQGAGSRGIVIAYDSRNHSAEFALESALVFAANGILSYIFDSLRPTPELSFAIRHLGAIAGVNITASHNPKEYNGYKVYWEDGAQLPPQNAKAISSLMQTVDIFDDVRTLDLEQANNLIVTIGEEIDGRYLQNVLAQSVSRESVEKCADDFSIIFTPFHGAGCRLVPEALSLLGFRHVIPVPEQIEPDGDFPTVKSPNPEEKAGFELAIRLAKARGIDLIIGTDPDADRVGIIVKAGDYVTMSGNQVGVLLLDYIIRAKKQAGTLAENAAAVKSIVSTEMAQAVCDRHGITLVNVLTGFKYIGEKIKEYESTGQYSFLFGFEESYGYLAGTYVRDKDAVVASMLIAEMACWYRLQGKTLYDAMEDLYKQYGYYKEAIITMVMEGLNVNEKMQAFVQKLRDHPPERIGGQKIMCIRDYLYSTVVNTATGETGNTSLPTSDMIYYELDDDSRFIVRPSGTEPKIKVYIMVNGESEKECDKKLESFAAACRELMD